MSNGIRSAEKARNAREANWNRRKAKPEDLGALFDEFDADGGGTVDYEEFAFTLKQAQSPPKKAKRKQSMPMEVDPLH